MTKGRKRLPDEIKKIRGTDQKSRLNPVVKGAIIKDIEAVISNPLVSALENERQRKIFVEKVNFLIALKTMEESYIDLLILYAINLDNYLTCMENVNKNGVIITVISSKGNPIAIENPFHKASKKAFDVVKHINSEFGFTPVSRMKFPSEKKEEKSLEAILEEMSKK